MTKRDTRTRTISKTPKALLWLLLLLLMGNRSCWKDIRPGGLTCTTQNVVVQPGQCVPISNPCDIQRQAQDGFKLCNEPTGLTIRTTRSRGIVTRELCADPATPTMSNVSVAFLYTQVGDFGEGSLNVTVGIPLSVAATANPGSIMSGETSQLTATANGGAGGYTYAWSPSSTLTDPNIANPVAAPIATTTYTVTVTDANSNTASASVTVNVSAATPPDLTVTANPITINAGSFTQLNAVLFAPVGVPTYSWTPVASVSNPNIQNPLGAPFETTTFQVTVTDASGSYTGSVTVTVNLGGFASANPAVIAPGGSSNLSIFAFGGTPPYSYAWTPASTLNDPTSPNPIATPTSSTQYDVTITDSTGASITRSTNVTVNGGALSACFTVNPASPATNLPFTIDMTCSTGNVARFRLFIDSVLVYDSTVPSYTTIVEVPSTLDVMLEVEEVGTMATASVQQFVTVQ